MPRRATLRVLLAVALVAGVAGAAPLPLELADPSGGEKVRVEAGDKALHVVFFATWCQPCLNELDALSQLEARWQERGYRLVLIAVPTRQSPVRLRRLAQEQDVPGRLLFDADGAAKKAFGAGDVPTHILFDAAGNEVLREKSLTPRVKSTIQDLIRSGGKH
ncbi:MAG: TlpA family protein disulfide reductase [bacterium]|nr:TlpA family protein disulfide reductase [bacterium]